MLNVGVHLGTALWVGAGGETGEGAGPNGGCGRPAGRQPSRWGTLRLHLVPCGFSMHTPPWSVARTAVAHAVLLAQA